jgi:hypothetical protein
MLSNAVAQYRLKNQPQYSSNNYFEIYLTGNLLLTPEFTKFEYIYLKP